MVRIMNKYEKEAEKHIEYLKRYYQEEDSKKEYKKEVKRKTGTGNKKRRKELRLFVRELKRIHHCFECNESDPACLGFHHLDPSIKEGNIPKGINNCWKIDRLVDEIDKCVVLCANCHAILHGEERTQENGKDTNRKTKGRKEDLPKEMVFRK